MGMAVYVDQWLALDELVWNDGDGNSYELFGHFLKSIQPACQADPREWDYYLRRRGFKKGQDEDGNWIWFGLRVDQSS